MLRNISWLRNSQRTYKFRATYTLRQRDFVAINLSEIQRAQCTWYQPVQVSNDIYHPWRFY